MQQKIVEVETLSLLSVESSVWTAGPTYNAMTVMPTMARCKWQLTPICQKFCMAVPGIHFGCLAAGIRPAAAATIHPMIRLRGKNLQIEFNRVWGQLYIKVSLQRRASSEWTDMNIIDSCDWYETSALQRELQWVDRLTLTTVKIRLADTVVSTLRVAYNRSTMTVCARDNRRSEYSPTTTSLNRPVPSLLPSILN
jgi:hypothetical protein